MDSEIANYKIAIIDPVGIKAGLDHYDVSLAKGLTKSGLSTVVLSNFNDPSQVVKQFDFYLGRSILNVARTILGFRSSMKKCKKAGVEIIILHVFHSSVIDRYFASLVKNHGFKLCVIIHDVENFVYKGDAQQKISDLADWIIVHNKFSREELSGKISVENKQKLHVIPHGHFIGIEKESEAELPLQRNDGDIHLLFFGMIKKSKGLDILIQALALLPEKYKLVIAGRERDGFMDSYKKLISELKLVTRVQMFVRYIANEERNYLFKTADIAVLPYRQIYQSGNLLMAMSYKLPVVVSDLPANREIIDGENGLLFNANDANDLAQKILQINNTNKSQMTEKAFDYVKREHDWEVIAKMFSKLFV